MYEHGPAKSPAITTVCRMNFAANRKMNLVVALIALFALTGVVSGSTIRHRGLPETPTHHKMMMMMAEKSIKTTKQMKESKSSLKMDKLPHKDAEGKAKKSMSKKVSSKDGKGSKDKKDAEGKEKKSMSKQASSKDSKGTMSSKGSMPSSKGSSPMKMKKMRMMGKGGGESSPPYPISSPIPTSSPTAKKASATDSPQTNAPTKLPSTPAPTGEPDQNETPAPTGTPDQVETAAPAPTPEQVETGTPSTLPSNLPSLAPSTPLCGCDVCTPEVLDTEVAGFTCRERITFLIQADNFTEFNACSFIATEFGDCGPCDPACSEAPSQGPTTLSTVSPTIGTANPTASPTEAPGGGSDFTCGCATCTDDVLALDGGGVSCGARIMLSQTPGGGGLTEEEACIAAGSTFPNCEPCNPETCNESSLPPATTCGCEACTDEILDRDADGLTCRTRINFLQEPDGGGLSELDACSLVASDFTDVCGSCAPCRRR